jgi:RNA polymerase sigma factor (sigma-70 family)
MNGSRDGLSADLADAFVRDHGRDVMVIARKYSASATDAEDAYQRALVALLTKAPQLDGPRLRAWMATVTRNEALMIRRERRSVVDDEFEQIAESIAADVPDPEEETLSSELMGQGREVLRGLRPDHVRCLLLRADGLGYPEICERTGFSYAKVNRCLSDGRKTFRARYEMLESGAECRRLADAISMFADGVADPGVCLELESHLENCSYCRATLRDYRLAPRDVASLFPVGAGLAASEHAQNGFGRAAGWVQDLADGAWARIAGHGGAVQPGSEVAIGRKIALVCAATATVVAGGAAVQKATTDHDRSAPRQAAAQSTPATLVSPIDLGANRRAVAAKRRRAAAKAAARRSEPSAAELARRVTKSQSAASTADRVDEATADETRQAAADPSDAARSGASDGSSASGGLAP